jgi:hypothetical protein
LKSPRLPRLSKILIGLILLLSLYAPEPARSNTKADSPKSNWNLKASVLGTLARFTIFEGEYLYSPHWNFGLGYTQLSASQTNKSIRLSGIKLYGNYYFKENPADSLWLGFYDGTNRVKASSLENDQFAQSDLQTTTFGLRAGYHWWWERLNLSLAYSIGVSVVSKVKIYDSLGQLTDEKDQGAIESGPELFLGYRF